MYSREDYLLFLLSGTTKVAINLEIGPQSDYPVTWEKALEFCDAVRAVSGMHYYIPTLYGMKELTRGFPDNFSHNSYWEYSGGNIECPNNNQGGIIENGLNHVALVRMFYG